MTLFDPSQPDATPPPLAVVFSTYNVAEAHIVAGRLQAHGIRAMVNQQAGASAMGITVGVLGEVTVLVREPDHARALALLAEADAPYDDSSGDLTDGATIVLPDDNDPTNE